MANEDPKRATYLVPAYDERDPGEFFGAVAAALLNRSGTTLRMAVEVTERGAGGAPVVHRVESTGPWWSEAP